MHASPAQEQRGLLGRFRYLPLWQSLAVRDFRLLWAGESISVLGDQFYFVALPWLTLQVSGSAFALSTVLMAAVIPRTILILFGGAIADRTSPRLLMLGSNTARGIVVAVLTVLVFAGQAQLWELYLLSFIFGVVDAVFYPAFDSMPPFLLPEERLGSGNALLQGSAQLASLLGPALAGLVIAAVGTATGNGSAFAVDAVSFFLAVVALLLMRGGRRRETSAAEQAPEEAAGLLGSIKQGISYVWHDTTLRVMVFVVLAANFAVSGPADVGLAALAHNRFGSAAAFGVMLSAFGLGALVGTIVAGSLGTLRRRGFVLIGVAATFSIGLLLIGLAPNAIVASAVLAILGASNGFIGVDIMTWLQAGTAESMMGRMMSLFTFANFGLTPLSLIASGAIAQVNLTGLFMLGAGLMGVVTLAVAASPTMRHFD